MYVWFLLTDTVSLVLLQSSEVHSLRTSVTFSPPVPSKMHSNLSHFSCRALNLQPFNHESGALTTELSLACRGYVLCYCVFRGVGMGGPLPSWSPTLHAHGEVVSCIICVSVCWERGVCVHTGIKMKSAPVQGVPPAEDDVRGVHTACAGWEPNHVPSRPPAPRAHGEKVSCMFV